MRLAPRTGLSWTVSKTGRTPPRARTPVATAQTTPSSTTLTSRMMLIASTAGLSIGYKSNKEMEVVEAGGLNSLRSAGGVATTNGTAVGEARQPAAKESEYEDILF